jgi:glyoxylase-like metal-dependent hydrolase (beta-lactamase superfamily II)
MKLGNWKLNTIGGGRFLHDGGVMYGVVPKQIWNRITPANDRNMIPMAINCVLVQTGEMNVLIDAGPGEKISPLDRTAHGLEAESPLRADLAALGLQPTDIDAVVFSHLHWDHAGGATVRNSDRTAIPAFPRATYFINQREWQDATGGAPELAGSYSADDFLPLEAAGQLVLVENGQQILPGITCLQTGGHTLGHQAIQLEAGGEGAIYLGDICPATTHVRPLWCTAYDLDLVATRQQKTKLLNRAAEENWWVLWDHDHRVAASRVVQQKKHGFAIVDPQSVL